jgi:hypothetical protein
MEGWSCGISPRIICWIHLLQKKVISSSLSSSSLSLLSLLSLSLLLLILISLILLLLDDGNNIFPSKTCIKFCKGAPILVTGDVAGDTRVYRLYGNKN